MLRRHGHISVPSNGRHRYKKTLLSCYFSKSSETETETETETEKRGKRKRKEKEPLAVLGWIWMFNKCRLGWAFLNLE